MPITGALEPTGVVAVEKDPAVNIGDVEKAPFREIVIDPIAEKKLVRKCDLHVVPILNLIFCAAFLDRINIGNAKIQGMIADLHMTGAHDYNIALFIFFIPYVLFEMPSNLILKRVRPSVWLSGIMVLWGIATMGQGLVRTKGGLIAMRFLLGLFEAGLYPGCLYLISMYYKRFELQWRFSLFFCSSILSGAFGGLLAYAIANMAGVANYGGWRWIFIIEGLATVVIAIISYFFIADWPETAKFLNEEERALLVARLMADQGEARMDRLDRRAAKRAFSDWKIYCGIFMYMGCTATGYGASFFIPTIIQELGYTAQGAQVRTIPIFVFGTLFSLVVAYASDKTQHRYAFTIGLIVWTSIGYIILLAQDGLSAGPKYMALFFIVSGAFSDLPLIMGWVSNAVGGHYKRSIASGMQAARTSQSFVFRHLPLMYKQGFGNCGGIIASNIFLVREAPKYPTGYGVAFALLWMSAICCTIFFFGLKWENRKRDRGERDWRLDEPDADNLGDDHPAFRFTT